MRLWGLCTPEVPVAQLTADTQTAEQDTIMQSAGYTNAAAGAVRSAIVVDVQGSKSSATIHSTSYGIYTGRWKVIGLMIHGSQW